MSTSGAKTPNMSNKWWTSWRSSWGHQSLLQEDPPVFLASTQGLLCKPEDTLCEHPSSAQMAFARVAPTLWNFITMRQARLLLHNPQSWSAHGGAREHSEQFGDCGGTSGRSKDTTARELITWRGVGWWAAEQRKPQRVGARHAGQFNPQMDTERHICNNAGSTQWWIVAQDRIGWERKLDSFLAKHDIPWATGKQAALTNLAPNRRQRNNRRRPRAITNDG